MKHSYVLLALVLAMFCGQHRDVFAAPAPESAQGVNRAREDRTVSAEELYYYDPSGLRIPLPIERKIIVRFVEGGAAKNNSEKEAYLKNNYDAVEVAEISGLYARAEYALTYPSTVDQKTMIATIKKMMADPTLDVAPVTVSDGMFAVVDGIYIETVTPLAKESVQAGITAYFGSDAQVHEITPIVDERSVKIWHVSFKRLFFLGDKGLPIHMLSLANILDHGTRKPVWVKRAFPKFGFLQEPVVATINVVPRSGTVGEARMAELVVLIYGKNEQDVVVDERELPAFHDRKFMIKANDKPPLTGFFDHGNPPPDRTTRTQVGPNMWKITHRYYFSLYAPEPEWTIAGVEIPYVYKGKRVLAKVPPMTFFVRPHLDEKYKLEDIPSAYLLPFGASAPGAPASSPTVASWYAPIAQQVRGEENLKVGAMLLSLASLAGLLWIAAAFVRRQSALAQLRDRERVLVWSADQLAHELDAAKSRIEPRAVLAGMHDVLSALLNQRFPEITPRNATFQQWKAIASDVKYQEIVATFDAKEIEQLFDDIELRNEGAFAGGEASVLNAFCDQIAAQIRDVGEKLRALPMEEKNGLDIHPLWA